MTEDKIKQTLQTLVPELISQDAVLCCAESCTGGWLAKSITDLEGSSQWFDCSIVTYSNQAKENLLGVKADTLNQFGAVSQAVVEEMVTGLLERSNANIGVSASGIAGPGGGSVEKPVGSVWIAWGSKLNQSEARLFQFKGDRNQVRIQAVIEALKGVQRILDASKNR